MSRPDTPIRARREILITLRALAGLVAEALRRTAASGDAATVARESARLAFWRDVQVYHTRRLLPDLVGDVDEAACRAFAERLVRTIYREDHDARDAGIDHDGARRRPVDPA